MLSGTVVFCAEALCDDVDWTRCVAASIRPHHRFSRLCNTAKRATKGVLACGQHRAALSQPHRSRFISHLIWLRQEGEAIMVARYDMYLHACTMHIFSM
eukprot:364899-Chlamydomonas_euryale.AAC.35